LQAAANLEWEEDPMVFNDSITVIRREARVVAHRRFKLTSRLKPVSPNSYLTLSLPVVGSIMMNKVALW
jgi:hypothetical protein